MVFNIFNMDYCNNVDNINVRGQKFDVICRICSETFEKDKGLHILGADGKRGNLLAKIRKYLYITVSAIDRLPKIICYPCYNKIESFHDFVLMANKNQIKFTLSIKSDSQDENLLNRNFQNRVEQKSVSLLESYLTKGTKEIEVEKEVLEELEVEVDPMWFLESALPNNNSDYSNNSQLMEKENIIQNNVQGDDDYNDDDDDDSDNRRHDNDHDYGEDDNLIKKMNDKDKNRIVKEHIKRKVNNTNVNNNNNNNNNHCNNNNLNLVNSPNISANNLRVTYQIPTSEIMAEIENKNNRKETHRRAYNCEICLRRFNSQVTLHNHLWIHSKQTKQCLDEKDEIENNDENLPLPGHSIFTNVENNEEEEEEEISNNENSCPICGKVVSTKGNMKVHLETHRPKGKYGCDDCGRIFKTQCNLQRHQRYHDGVKYSCEVCGRVYSTNSTLRAHAVTHSELRPHECPLCEKKFKRNQDLKFHINQHTGAKPYRCPYCPKAFASSGNCFSHRKRMHPVEVERDREKAAKFM